MLSSLLIASIGIAGGTTIYQTSQTLRRELSTEYQLFAENRAFALRDNLQILEDELARLALLPPITAGRGSLKGASQVLSGAHENSVLYNTAVLLLSADGQCIEAEPDVPEFDGQKFGDRPWFRLAASGAKGPILRASDEPGLGRTIKIVQPIRRDGVFAGALVGVIALSDANLITPALREHLPPGTDGLLIDSSGTVIFPADRVEAAVGTDWAGVINAARHDTPGSLFGSVAGQEALFAWAPVQAGSGYAVVFAWPWRLLNANLQKQVATLVGLLIFGIVVASLVGLLLSTYLTRPLVALADSAARIARGDALPKTLLPLPKPTRAAEVRALVGAFEKMETAIERRDQELRDGAASLERRVRERTQELVETQKALVDAERFAAMGKTSAAIAHEIKNVLNGLGMAVELILQDPTNKVRVPRLQAQVVGEIARLRDVIDSLLSFSRSPRIERRPVDLVPIIHRAVEVLADVITDRSVAITVDVPPALVVDCDAHKVEGILVNLIKNAAQAGRRVRVEATEGAGEVVIDVADDGPGLSEDARLHLFEPFFTTKPNGTGLGLPTSLRYVEAHGGTLETVAASGEGARFRIRLPQPRKDEPK